MSNTPATPRTQLLSFVLSGDEYAVDILRVREIIEYDTPTPMPGMPPAVRGVINLRGRVVPVVDLAVRFGLPASAITRHSSIVMVELAGAEGEGNIVVGIITDSVSAVLELDTVQIQPAPSFGTAVGTQFLDGMADDGNQKFVMLLNIDRSLGADAFAAAVAVA